MSITDNLQHERSKLISERNMVLAAEQAKLESETAAARRLEEIDLQLAEVERQEQAQRRQSLGDYANAAAAANAAAIEDLYAELENIVTAIARIRGLTAVTSSYASQQKMIEQIIGFSDIPQTGNMTENILATRKIIAQHLTTIQPAVSAELALRQWVEVLPAAQQQFRAGIVLALTGTIVRHDPAFNARAAAADELRRAFITS